MELSRVSACVQVDALRQAREHELTIHEQEYNKVADEKQMAGTRLQQREEEIKRLQKEIETLNHQVKKEARKAKHVAQRILTSAPACGRRSDHSSLKELRSMRGGCILEMLTKSSAHRPDPRFFKVRKNCCNSLSISAARRIYTSKFNANFHALNA